MLHWFLRSAHVFFNRGLTRPGLFMVNDSRQGRRILTHVPGALPLGSAVSPCLPENVGKTGNYRVALGNTDRHTVKYPAPVVSFLYLFLFYTLINIKLLRWLSSHVQFPSVPCCPPPPHPPESEKEKHNGRRSATDGLGYHLGFHPGIHPRTGLGRGWAGALDGGVGGGKDINI